MLLVHNNAYDFKQKQPHEHISTSNHSTILSIDYSIITLSTIVITYCISVKKKLIATQIRTNEM